MNLRSVIQVFAKYPHVGQVKTRLASETGPELAAEVHCELVERQLDALMRLPGYVRLELWCTEDADALFYKTLFERWPRLRYCRQRGGELGERLGHALACSMPRSSLVLQIGTDCPVLHRPQIMAAIEELNQGSDTVFIPAEDGGYVLGGYTVYQRELFEHVEWSTCRVMFQVQSQLDRYGYSVSVLPTLWDIDYLADLERYRGLRDDDLE